MLHAAGRILRNQIKFILTRARGQCQARNLCARAVVLMAAYFSSISSTLPWAEKTGNLTLRPFSVVHSIIYDEKKEKARVFVLLMPIQNRQPNFLQK